VHQSLQQQADLRVKSDVGVVLGAAMITLVQLALFLSAAQGRSWNERYQSAFQWDSVWYADIARRGYVTTNPPVASGEVSNVTHFPGYPLAIRGLQRSLRFTYRNSALMTAQACTWGFWTYTLSFFRRWRVSLPNQALGVVFIVAHPMAFFLVVPYSEPMFLMTVVGFWHWCVRESLVASSLSALHGMAACATRLSGAVCVFSPFMYVLPADGSRLSPWARALRALAVTAISLLGLALFLAYCYAQFGIWNLYQIRQMIGWGHRFDAWAFFYPSAYRFFIPNWHDQTSVGIFLNPFTLAAVVVLIALSFRRGIDTDGRHFALSSLGILYVTIACLYHTHFPQMARYQFQVHTMLIIGYVHALGSGSAEPPGEDSTATTSVALHRVLTPVLGVAAGILVWKSLDLQLYFASLFSRGGPVL
jgi:hypothetical protein